MTSVGTKSIESLRVNNYQFLRPPPLVWWVLNEATVDSAPLDALEQFEDQATNRLLLSALEGCEDQGTTQQKRIRRHQPKCYHQLYVYMYCIYM